VTPEGRVKDAVKKALVAQGVHPFTDFLGGRVTAKDMRGFFYMPVAGPHSVLGIHDFVGCWDGYFFTLETKALDNPIDATHHQQMFKLAADASGALSYVGVRDASVVEHLRKEIEARRAIRESTRGREILRAS
jgi:hypothetical protein